MSVSPLSPTTAEPCMILPGDDRYTQLVALKFRYFSCVDQRTWEGLRDVFSPRVKLRGYGFGHTEHIDQILEGYSGVFQHILSSRHRGSHPIMVQGPSGTVRVRWRIHDVLLFTQVEDGASHPLAFPGVPKQQGVRGSGWYEDEVLISPRGASMCSSRLIRTNLTAITPQGNIPLPIPARSPSDSWLYAAFNAKDSIQ